MAAACGLIPAWAGKTLRRDRTENPPKAHPRVGGENSSSSSQFGRSAGSSPRGRGKLPDLLIHFHVWGLIPAWAGKTVSYITDTNADRAHPRVGGENCSTAASVSRSSGSSPRGRGKPLQQGTGPFMRRLIPAWAGKTVARQIR